MKYLAIGPAAMGMFSLMGAVYSLKDKLKNIEEISGASAGSFIGLFLSLGKTPEETIEFLFQFDFMKFYKLKLKNLISKYGFVDFSDFKIYLKDFLNCDPKFKDLSKKLYVAVYNVNYEKTEYLSIDTHPEMSVIDAVCISMSIPLVCTSTVVNDIHYSDGGMFETVPLNPFIDKPKEEVIGIELDFLNIKDRKIKNIKDFLSSLYSRAVRGYSSGYDKKKFNIITVRQLNDISIFNFKMTQEDKMKLFFDGYNTARFQSGLAI